MATATAAVFKTVLWTVTHLFQLLLRSEGKYTLYLSDGKLEVHLAEWESYRQQYKRHQVHEISEETKKKWIICAKRVESKRLNDLRKLRFYVPPAHPSRKPRRDEWVQPWDRPARSLGLQHDDKSRLLADSAEVMDEIGLLLPVAEIKAEVRWQAKIKAARAREAKARESDNWFVGF